MYVFNDNDFKFLEILLFCVKLTLTVQKKGQEDFSLVLIKTI